MRGVTGGDLGEGRARISGVLTRLHPCHINVSGGGGCSHSAGLVNFAVDGKQYVTAALVSYSAYITRDGDAYARLKLSCVFRIDG